MAPWLTERRINKDLRKEIGIFTNSRNAATSFDVAHWKVMKLPQPLETAGLNIDGAVWFRKEIDVPASWVGKDLLLGLGPIDDFDVTYLRVGATGSETQLGCTTNFPRVCVIGKFAK